MRLHSDHGMRDDTGESAEIGIRRQTLWKLGTIF